jgi:hypothetical protein
LIYRHSHDFWTQPEFTNSLFKIYKTCWNISNALAAAVEAALGAALGGVLEASAQMEKINTDWVLLAWHST